MVDTNQSLTIGIIAGEASGDLLGADFMAQMTALHPNMRWVGVGGAQMQARGLVSVIDMGRLSVMGLLEVVKHLPDLLSAKKEILSAFRQANIDIFVGIDAPDFNLRIGKALKKYPNAPYCVQYVSPSIWAWREGRIHTIKEATDLVLCLFPFELDVYARHHHPAVCVGHPLLDKLNPDERSATACFRSFLDKFSPTFPHLTRLYDCHARPICVMAGSRTSEIRAILPLLIDSMIQLNKAGEFCYLMPVVSHQHAQLVSSLIGSTAPSLLDKVHLIFGEADEYTISQHTMNASELILLASGTATLEALLLHRPMVVVYQVNTLTYAIAKRLIKIPHVSLPNILSHNQTGRAIVPELIQENATATTITNHARQILHDPSEQIAKLASTTARLRQDSRTNPAQAVLTHFFQV